MDGVREIEVDVGALQVRILPQPDRTVDLAALRPALAPEGIRLRRIRIVAEGRVERAAAGLRFRIAGWPDAFPLTGADLPEGPARVRASVTFEDDVPQLQVVASGAGED